MPYNLNMPDGTTLKNIPDEIDPKTAGTKYMLKYGSSGSPTITPKLPGQPNIVMPGGPDGINVEDAIKYGIGQTLPMAGSLLAGPLGTAAGSLAKSALPTSFGGATDTGDVVGNLGEDLLSNEVVPGVGNKLLSLGKTLVNQGPRGAIASVLASRPLSWSAGIKGAISKDAANESASAQGELSQFQEGTQQQQINQVPPLLRSVTGPEKTQLNQVIRKGYSPTTNTIDPDAILKEFDNPKADYSGIQGSTKQNVVDLMNSLKDTQNSIKVSKAASTPDTVNTNGNNLIRWLGHRLVFDAALSAPSLIGGALSGHEAAGMAGMGLVVLGESALNKLMENPAYAKLVVAASKTSSSNQAAPLLQKAILHGLGNGVEVYVNTPDGQEKAVVNNGQVQLPR